MHNMMRKFYKSCLAMTLAAGLGSASASIAHAEYYLWQDQGTGLTISFPDTWKEVSSNEPDDVLTIMPPSGRAHAACRVRVREDGRSLIYPPRLSDAIQKTDYSLPFWEKYLKEYNDAKIVNFRDGAGLGRGFASYATAEYDSAVQGPYMHRKALMFASLYDDKAYVLECSSHRDAFNDWKGLFLSIAGSMDFRKIDNELITGNYRNFLADPKIEFEGVEGNETTYY